MKKVIIIGAGPAGLTVALELLRKAPDQYDITILEESGAIGRHFPHGTVPRQSNGYRRSSLLLKG